ncbi:(d)CMP kinase [soil metagenome]
MVIAIDGPAASGKSSTAQWVAQRLGYLHVDSGSLYRALTAATLRTGEPVEGWTADVMLAQGDRISLRPGAHAFEALIDGAPVEDELRGSVVTTHVSQAARMPAVRAWVNDRVRRAAETQHVVVDGRDMGTAVFPDAPLKIFLIADPWERARRRLTQRLDRRATDAEIAEEVDALVQRDARDATQTVQAKDAVVLDTTYLTQVEQVERIVALAHAVSHRPYAT